MQEVTVSPDFKKKATRAVGAILFFIVTYIVLIGLAVCLAIACGYLAIGIIALKAAFITLMLALGIFGVGLLTIYFLIKFMFTGSKTDLSRFTEITRSQEPQLFALIDDIVNEAGTDFPKKVFLSHDVNASVFYDSSFWSMFLPIRKNLNIGLGLMNSVTVDELKGILAHEFGHFSQRSMKVGSYVYSVNYIIHNMLYDNDSYGELVGKLASVNSYVSIPLMGGVKIVQGIQYLLQQVYRVVNVNYLALSREMEFHADEVAARIAGPDAISSSLVRLELADKSLNAVLGFYGNKVSENTKPANIYPLQFFTMTSYAKENGLDFQYGFPVVDPANAQRFNKSRINIDNQWASHPSTEDRIARVESLQLKAISVSTAPAISLLSDSDKTGEIITGKLFSTVQYTGEVTLHAPADYESEFIADKENYVLPKKFNNYFDDHDINKADVTEFSTANTFTDVDVFSDEKTDLVYTAEGLKNDIKLLQTIQNKDYGIKSFDYASTRYSREDANGLIPKLEIELKNVDAEIRKNDLAILNHFLVKADTAGKREEYLSLYNSHCNFDTWYNETADQIKGFYSRLQFVNITTPAEEIQRNFINLQNLESSVKDKIKAFVANADNKSRMNNETINELETYCNRNLSYFDGGRYNNDNLGILFGALSAFNSSINETKFGRKKRFLDFMAGL